MLAYIFAGVDSVTDVDISGIFKNTELSVEAKNVGDVLTKPEGISPN
jgi:hypothetical protein